jgi:hypothetical protein
LDAYGGENLSSYKNADREFISFDDAKEKRIRRLIGCLKAFEGQTRSVCGTVCRNQFPCYSLGR